jgi:hypothetical protein
MKSANRRTPQKASRTIDLAVLALRIHNRQIRSSSLDGSGQFGPSSLQPVRAAP